ncbi:DUF4129 domain-containing protein [Microlunatus parietis]|uniref:Protein-glutamine gamma-glutamyltransferase-like C-terminal domain-containing protein n=1 Tax=Microlunatus parietis TaxID=682979 RepID=A0A7Y9LBF5_9ACTN|nr:DUF4129 domain-containing protein [Microlunatus parietis]NYE69781.1 hypothetical protein [Microlunatus parietis]
MIPLDVPVELSREEARRRVLEELGKSRYAEMPQWLRDLLQWLSELLERIVTFVLGVSSGPAAAGGGINVAFVVILVLIAAGIALLIWKVGLPRWQTKRRRDAEVDLSEELEPDDYRSAAQRFAAAGDWRSAVRDRFRAVVKELEIATILDPRPARTAFEASALAGRALPEQAAALDAGARTFSEVMYGDRVADTAAYQRMAELDDRIGEAARQADLAGDEPEPAAGRGAGR